MVKLHTIVSFYFYLLNRLHSTYIYPCIALSYHYVNQTDNVGFIEIFIKFIITYDVLVTYWDLICRKWFIFLVANFLEEKLFLLFYYSLNLFGLCRICMHMYDFIATFPFLNLFNSNALFHVQSVVEKCSMLNLLLKFLFG